MKRSDLKNLVREIIQQQLNERAKWRSSSAAEKVPDPFGDRADYHGNTSSDGTYLRAKSDTPHRGSDLEFRGVGRMAHGPPISDRGPNKGKALKTYTDTIKSQIRKAADNSGVPDHSPAPPEVVKAASKQAGGRIVFGRYFDRSGTYLGKSSGGKWVPASQDSSPSKLESLIRLEAIIKEEMKALEKNND